MRVLLVDSGSAWRGGQRQTALLAGALRDRNVDVHIASPLITVPGVTTVRWSSSSDLSLIAAYRLARFGPFDVVHAMDGRAHAAARLARLFGLSAPLVVTRHITRVPSIRLKYQGVSRYIAVSSAARDALLRLVDARHITVIPPAMVAPAGNGAADLTAFGVNPGDHVIVTVAALTREKGVDRVVELAARAGAWALKAKWLIVGDGPERSALERRVHAAGAPVIFLGWRDDVPNILRAAHVMVHLPRAEGFGLSVMEALACGVPVVAADVGGLSDFLAAGSLVDPEDWESIVYAIRRCLEDDALRQRATALGPAIAASYGLDQMVDATLSIYAQVLVARRTSEQTFPTFTTSPTSS